jgi:hypothetical protein
MTKKSIAVNILRLLGDCKKLSFLSPEELSSGEM